MNQQTLEAANDISEPSTDETTILKAVNPSLSEMPPSEKDMNEALKQLRPLGQKVRRSRKESFRFGR